MRAALLDLSCLLRALPSGDVATIVATGVAVESAAVVIVSDNEHERTSEVAGNGTKI